MSDDATLQMQLLLRRFYLADGDISFREISTATINSFENRIVKYWIIVKYWNIVSIFTYATYTREHMFMRCLLLEITFKIIYMCVWTLI